MNSNNALVIEMYFLLKYINTNRLIAKLAMIQEMK